MRTSTIPLLLLAVLFFIAPFAYADIIRIPIPDGGFESGILFGEPDHWGCSGNYYGIASTLTIPGTSITVFSPAGDKFGYNLTSATQTIHQGEVYTQKIGAITHIITVQAGDKLVGSYFSYLSAVGITTGSNPEDRWGMGTKALFDIFLYKLDPATHYMVSLEATLVSSTLNSTISGVESYIPWTEISYVFPTDGKFTIYAEAYSLARGTLPPDVPIASATSDFGLDNFYLEREGESVPEPSALLLLSLGLVAMIACGWRHGRA